MGMVRLGIELTQKREALSDGRPFYLRGLRGKNIARETEQGKQSKGNRGKDEHPVASPHCPGRSWAVNGEAEDGVWPCGNETYCD